ncbi:MAG: histidine triad nucleotide-binding protein [Actinobacteria bacterium]|nr:histidine triad nucleotide-binding protein [Actinomycetota bacterium]
MDCLFCKIINKEITSDMVFEDDDIAVIRDVNPVAPVHLLLIPKQHISSILEIDKFEDRLSSKILMIISQTARKMKIDGGGFRVVTNTGDGAGQSIKHLHFHILGGRKFTWPPG